MNSFIICAFLASVASVTALNFRPDEKADFFVFEAWRNQHNKLYQHGEEAMFRFNVFRKNLMKIKEHNEKYEKSEVTWFQGMNQFGDMTPAEFSEYVAMSGKFQPRSDEDEKNALNFEQIIAEHDVSVSGSIDWVDEGAVAEVKNQKQCGSCWSFSTTGAIEGAYAIKTGKLQSLSEQQLIDCSTRNHGCHGGVMDWAFQYVISTGGLTTEAAYPYQMAQGTCRASQYDFVASISGFKDVARMNEQALKAAVNVGPVSVAIEADQQNFQFYKGGVLTSDCGTKLDHGVLVVGYGEEGGQKYWKVKNSWGSTWGELGYIRIMRDVNDPRGHCGVAMQPCYPVV